MSALDVAAFVRKRRSSSRPIWAVLASLGMSVACRERPVASRPDAATPVTTPSSTASARATKPPPIAVLALPAGHDSAAFPKGAASVPDPHFGPSDRVSLGDDFVFELGTGDGVDGLDVTTLAAAGVGRHVWRSITDGGQRWSTADFQVSEAELQKLVALLEEIHFLTQPRGIVANVHDGAGWIVFLRTNGREKYVTLSNAFPEPFVRLGRFVVGLVNRHPDLRDKRREFEESGLHDRHLWRGVDAYGGSSEPYYLFLCALPEASSPFTGGTGVRGRLVDRTRASVVGTMAARISPKTSRPCLDVRARDIDATHEYELELELTGPSGKRTKLAPAPVLTKGAPRVVVIPNAARDE